MANTKTFSKMRDKFAAKKVKFKQRNHTRNTPDEILEEEYDRLDKYIDLKFSPSKLPVTDDEMREHIKISFKKDPFFRSVAEESHDSSYTVLIDKLMNSENYKKALADSRKTIIIKKTKRQRQGTTLKQDNRFFFSIRKAHYTKRGVRVAQQKRYYDANTGKAVRKDRIEMLVKKHTTKRMLELDRIKRIRKPKTKLQEFRQKEAKTKRLKKLRGK